jgi:DNA-binding NtrC family response regulator
MDQKEQKDLEDTIKEKVNPLLEETMEKHWGITIPKLEDDLTTKLKNPSLNIYVPLNLTFSAAKKVFKTEFMKRELRLHQGNISHLAKHLGIDRRSIHRTIKELKIDVDEIRNEMESSEEHQTEFVDQALRATLDQYKELIQPQKMEKMYEEVHSLSRNIAKILPHKDLSWKDAEQEFEKQFLEQELKENKGSVMKTAAKIKIRAETLHRKIKKLGLRD